jgi:hypothetical protein
MVLGWIGVFVNAQMYFENCQTFLDRHKAWAFETAERTFNLLLNDSAPNKKASDFEFIRLFFVVEIIKCFSSSLFVGR